MACAHPFLYNPYSHNKKKQYRIKSFNQLFFPCGWCTNCRVDKLNSLMHRCEYEYIKFMCGSFVTFTYDDFNLQSQMHYDSIDKKLVASLSKKEAKLFLDRLNKLVHSKPNTPFCNHDYKYLLVGEYGEHSSNPDLAFRPHYHVLFFGLDFDLCKDLFAQAWQDRGAVYIGNIGDGAIRYCLKYLDKQIFGDLASMKYDNHGMQRPFQHHSLGLGNGLYESQQDYIKTHNFCYHWHGHDTPVPTYFRNKYWRNNISPEKARHELRKKQVDKFISEFGYKPKNSYQLKQFQLNNALRKEKLLNIKFQQSGEPIFDRQYLIDEQLNAQASRFGIHRLNLPPLDINYLITSSLKGSVKVRRKSWQKRAIESCKSTDIIPF